MTEAGEKSTRPQSRSSDHNERLEPQLLRAAENNNVDLLRTIIDAAEKNGQLSPSFLRIALMRSSEKGSLDSVRFLLEEHNAPPNGVPGNRLSPLLLAVQRHDTVREKQESLLGGQRTEKRNNLPIIRLLIEHSADLETRDKKGRTPLMTAAWLNHFHILDLLIHKGANVNAKDARNRNVLHNLAADKAMNFGADVLDLLFAQKIVLDGPEAQDELGRVPLHWACATGKVAFAERLLSRTSKSRAHIEAVEIREKTCLHLAAAHDREEMVELLLSKGANVSARSDGGWTPLFVACEKGHVRIVRMLLNAGADVNAKLLNGMTALHLAAQFGHSSVVKCLLARKDIKRAVRDSFGSTPFLRAAQSKSEDIARCKTKEETKARSRFWHEILDLLAPSNNLDGMSKDALGACNGFNATIVDFGNFRNGNRVVKRTVFELLYGRDRKNEKPAIDILSKEKAIDFRWVHLPANNMAWVEALLAKTFIEEGAVDIEGFKALERSLNLSKSGQQSHSHFMRPLCLSSARAVKQPDPEPEPENEPETAGTPLIVLNGSSTPSRPKSPASPASPDLLSRAGTADSKEWFRGSLHHGKEAGKQKEKNKKPQLKGGGKSPKGTETPSKDHSHKQHRQHSYHHRGPSTPASHSKKDLPANVTPARGNVFLFMPYLHFESTHRRREMQDAIKRAEMHKSHGHPFLQQAKTCDEMLIRAHLNSSTASLHVRRTLDQSFYHNIDTQSRDEDQVVYRYQLRGQDANEDEVNPNIIMIDQLWCWILGKDLIVTAFPQRWQQPKNDPLNVLDSVIEDINSKTRDTVRSVYDLAMVITNRCTGVFDRHRAGDENYQFLDMFESSIGNATDRETVLFKEFNEASMQASAWLQQNRRANRFARALEYKSMDSQEKLEAKSRNKALKEENLLFETSTQGPIFVDQLLDIGDETDLLAETKDIRDELNMIEKVMGEQRHVLPDLESAICELYLEEQKSQQDVKKRFREQLKTIEMHVKDIERMDKQAKRIYDSITDMLDLKQKHANAFEARFARDQAAGTAKQTQTIILFTIVTIIFLPLSFIASFFAIPVTQYPHDDGNLSLPLGYVSRYTFGIGFAISIPLVVIALNLGDIGDLIREVRRRVGLRLLRRKQNAGHNDTSSIVTTAMSARIEKALSIARTSLEYDLRRERLSNSNDRPLSLVGEGLKQRVATGFRMRLSSDIERGPDIFVPAPPRKRV